MQLQKWAAIKSAFTDRLIIGNGASIAVDSRFSFDSLFDAARNAGLISKRVAKVFTQFGTNDFEYVLRGLSTAHTVNQILQVPDRATKPAYHAVKTGLISVIGHIHPDRSDIEGNLPAISRFLRHFKTVFSLNYDLIAYWGMLHANENIGKNRLKDCFDAKRRFVYDNEWLRTPFGRNRRTTLVFYPHGSLFLGVDAFGTEEKIVSDSRRLVDVITQKWQVGGVTPLFVSEGSAGDKLRAIRRNGYLNYVYTERLSQRPDTPETLVIYGWSISDQDDHIVDALRKSRPKRVAVSFFAGNPNWRNEVQKTLLRLKQGFGIRERDVVFFRSDDVGAWNS